jgi:3-hydroxyisobutyrate dehydrogenase
MAKVAFIGVGVMGGPMAGHLLAKGHDVTVSDRLPAQAEAWVAERGGALAATPRQAAAGAEFVLTSVGTDDDLRDAVLGETGAFAGMAAGSVFVDHTTASAAIARELHALGREQGVDFLDAPVSGGQSGAVEGVLSVMCGGEVEPFERARPLIEAYARACDLIGPAGAGQLCKMVNQICGVGVIQGLAEGMNFGLKAGLDMDKVLAVVSKGAAASWQMDNRAPTMCRGEFDFGFAVDWMRKDLRLCLDEARRNGARLPTIALIEQFYGQLQARGGGRWDASSLINLLAQD